MFYNKLVSGNPTNKKIFSMHDIEKNCHLALDASIFCIACNTDSDKKTND